jgi:hypothetical protein
MQNGASLIFAVKSLVVSAILAGAPLFRVLCERVGGSAGMPWLCDGAPERS